MNPETLLTLVLFVGVFSLVTAIGARSRPEQALALVRMPGLALRSLAAMYLVLPAFVLLLITALPLRPGVGAVLLAYAVAPVLPPWAKKGTSAGGEADYVIGLEVLSVVASLVIAPLMIWLVRWIFGVVAAVDPLAVEAVLVATVLLPLALGMGLARFLPERAPRIAAVAERAGGVMLLVGVISVLAVRGRDILSVFGQGTLLVILAVIAFGMVAGQLLGGPTPGNRRALASATISRHPAVALLLASSAFPELESTVLGTVLLYLLAALLVPTVYERWTRGGRRGG